MKRGMVLLLTLFFIATLSVLILKNLNDTESIIDQKTKISSNTQVIILVQNLQQNIMDILRTGIDKEDKDTLLNTILSNEIAFDLEENINVQFTLNSYDKLNINKVLTEEKKMIEDFFEEYKIYDFDQFESVFKRESNYQKVLSSKQLDDIIVSFTRETDNREIQKYKNDFGFIEPQNSYDLTLKIKHYNTLVEAYYIFGKINNEIKVQYFDINFKE